VEAANDEIRTGLGDTYEDYAQQALEAGDRFGYDLWMRAADIARGYVPRPSVMLGKGGRYGTR
jgi:hypothetical protein